ncbi:MAG: thrombospondin type 3 repeat-containing protein [Polyangiaceae bacterium]
MGSSPRRCRTSLVSAAAVVAALSMTSSTRAQQLPSLDARTFRPSTDPNASLVIEPAVTPGPGVLSVGSYLHYGYRPLTLRRGSTDEVAFRPIEHVLGADVVANLGIGERFALGLALPVTILQDGSPNLPPTVSEVDRAPLTAFGDLGLSMKGAIVRNEGGGFGLAGLGYFSLPTGSRTGFAGEGAVTASARLLAEYTLFVATAQASLGYKLRTDHQVWPSSSVGGFTFGDELPWHIGVGVRPGIFGIDKENRQRVEVAAHGWLPAGPVGPFGAGERGSAALSPAMLAVSDRVELGKYRDSYFLAGAEVGLNQAVGVPAMRFFLAVGWAPREHDKDHDGVPDDLDLCPEIPEDKDGIEDEDGCPEIDVDDDGIIDTEDACPRVPGVASKDPKKNGCPLEDADGDGIADDVDACPKEKGVASTDPKKNGCPVRDTDGDGIPDDVDKCPNQPEDKDGFEDEDGCPDPDNDKDGIADVDDACPDEAGVPSSDPKKNGCPVHDRDGDTFEDDVDKCPDEPETFNGVDDEDGCPDKGGALLVTVDPKLDVRLSKRIELTPGKDPDVSPKSIPTLRALAMELNRHPEWTLAVGAKPPAGDADEAQMASLARSFAIVRALSPFLSRDGSAETVGWDAVKGRPGAAQSGVGLLILVTPSGGAPAVKKP